MIGDLPCPVGHAAWRGPDVDVKGRLRVKPNRMPVTAWGLLPCEDNAVHDRKCANAAVAGRCGEWVKSTPSQHPAIGLAGFLRPARFRW